MWNHFDAGGCPGQAIGIRVRLDNGVMGYIHLKNLSDKHVNDPEERVRLGQVIHCRIMKIEYEKFSIEATSKATDLNDSNNKWRFVVFVISTISKSDLINCLIGRTLNEGLPRTLGQVPYAVRFLFQSNPSILESLT